MMSLNVVADSENADRIFLNDVDISASCQIFSSFLRYGQLGTQPSAFSPILCGPPALLRDRVIERGHTWLMRRREPIASFPLFCSPSGFLLVALG